MLQSLENLCLQDLILSLEEMNRFLQMVEGDDRHYAFYVPDMCFGCTDYAHFIKWVKEEFNDVLAVINAKIIKGDCRRHFKAIYEFDNTIIEMPFYISQM